MKLVRYGAAGSERPGLLDSDRRVRDLSASVPDIDGACLEDLDRLRAVDPQSLSLVERPGRLGPCIKRPGKFICVGLNYVDHAAESGAVAPAEPILFLKATSAICGPDDDVIIPRGAAKTDWEVELGVVIGRHSLYLADDEAARAAIAGYCVVNDLSERAFQLERGGQWDKGKGCDTFGPIGPWLVTADEVADPSNLRLWLTVNGRQMQDGNTANMIFSVPDIVRYCSQFMSLEPGDIISTGTPAGVGLGMKPPVYLRPGDVIELGIDGLGCQRQHVVACPS